MKYLNLFSKIPLNYITLIHIFTLIHALSKGYLLAGILLFLEVIFSYNYWINPKPGWRRNADILMTFINGVYFSLLNFKAMCFLLPLFISSYIVNTRQDHLFLWKFYHINVFIIINYILWNYNPK
jgi:hypothetical protein